MDIREAGVFSHKTLILQGKNRHFPLLFIFYWTFAFPLRISKRLWVSSFVSQEHAPNKSKTRDTI
jgi:hypothetical protein